MISAYDLASRDVGGASDPYVKVSCGEQEFSERDNYALDEPNPDFGSHYDFPVVFPGCPPIRVDIMDYDDLFGDDLIGTSWIDLEDRYFLAEWRALAEPTQPQQHQQQTPQQLGAGHLETPSLWACCAKGRAGVG